MVRRNTNNSPFIRYTTDHVQSRELTRMNDSAVHLSMNHQTITACAECDLLIEEIPVDPGCNILCPRCGHVIREGRPDSIMNALVLSTTGLVLFIPAVGLPLLSMSILGLREDASLIKSIIQLSDAGYWEVSTLVFAAAVLAPFLNLWLMFIVSLTLYFSHPSKWLRWVLRINHHAREWAMTEVFFLGVLVSIVKLKELAHLIIGMGLIAFLGLMLTCVMLNSVVDDHELWESLENHHE